ncbi:Uncharacterized membrane protein [Methylobacterium sp. 174MFSha1.1]|uniref:DUF2254 domain-containing protein n=1 Tax=Methylobacterium sp. 174MFSha1.1 TaxID=1502749 RepID=UPI0008EE351A|nr:DUF2254 domain-containing protein [Methylobacterium sp. 174MFSha1.1]SFU90020.1 Uncharacterized membrane protein [Methylobacterium sp. 174MFSha1.1]
MGRWAWVGKRVVRQVWFRAALISLFGVALAVVAALVGPFLPGDVHGRLGQDAVGTILQIMASSMLAVTTFSLTAMVSAYGSATQLATPRATQLLIGDPTSQNALSTFLGAFVFSVVGIIGLQSSLYGDSGRVVLFGGTVLVVAVVVVTLLRWIGHITGFGRMGDVIDRVEEAAAEAMRAFSADPRLGGRPAIPVPAGARPVFADETGYVTHIDVASLGAAAARRGLVLHVAALPGTLVHPTRPLLHVEGDLGEEGKTLAHAFAIERHRRFDQDPRLGLIALSEIASRALAPATNDPGTAIEVLNALLRVLLHLPPDDPEGEELAERPPVHVPRPMLDDMLTDAFRPLIREGTAEIEVTIRLAKTLQALADARPYAAPSVARIAGRLDRAARAAITDPADLADYETAQR